MSFFSNGFATFLNKRRNKVAKSNVAPTDEQVDTGNTSDRKEKKDDGRWEMLTDVYGRLYMQHSVTGEWSFVYGSSGLAPPVPAVHPSPMVYPCGTVFTPSPTPVAMVNTSPMVYPSGAAVFASSSVYPVATAMRNEEGSKKDGDEKEDDEGTKKDDSEEPKNVKGKGWWEAMYNEEGVRYWVHTVSKKQTYKDPYF